jgi:hypothetical protein
MRYLRVASLVLVWLLIAAINFPICVAQTSSSPASGVSAEKLRSFAQHPQWLALLHYDLSLSHRSRATDQKFFLASTGDTDPHAELLATLAAMRQPVAEDDSHAICRYPARSAWITKALEIEATELPAVACNRFKKWRDAISPQSITVVFPTSFLNNPASAFGHTFIRLDQKEDSDSSALLDYAADFAASTHDENALAYALKGIFGGFDGYYTVAPFFKSVEKYSDLENRDIWEYRLNFTQEERELLTAHLWELREHQFTYFYFDENCSYQILALLNVARPSLQLLEGAGLWVIPVDTIRLLHSRPGLIQKATFRASAATKLRTRIGLASSHSQAQAIAIATQAETIDGALQEIQDDKERAAILDLAYEYLSYETIRDGNDSDRAKQLSWQILAARSAIPRIPEVLVDAPDIRPEGGHRTALLSIGAGSSEDRAVGEVVFRPAFHTLSDPIGGYLPGNQIKFFEIAARHSEGRGTELNRFNALDIMALTPRETFFQPISWRVNLGYRQYQREGLDPLGLGALSVGAGRTYRLGAHSLVYAMLDADFEFSSMLERGHAFGLGPRGGLILTVSERIASDISVARPQFLTGDSHSELVATASQRFTLTEDTIVRFDLSYIDAFENKTWNPMLRIERFFTP